MQKSKSLKPVYLISGDVPLLLQEARDNIRKLAKNNEYLQREIINIEPGFDWEIIQHHLQNRNLFSEKSIIDIRLDKWEERASKIVLTYLENPATDIILILSTPKLTSAQKKTKWYKAIATKGEAITIWPITPYELPQWIRQRLNAAKLNADHESIQLLAEWTEGNLLATQQAIEKLQLLYRDETINRKMLENVLNDNARFTIFDLSNAALNGNPYRVSRILTHLRLEGIEPTLILWTLAREIRNLIQLLFQKEHGTPISQLLEKEWQSRKALVKSALERQSYNNLLICLKKASRIDGIIKGRIIGNQWNALESLALLMAGR